MLYLYVQPLVHATVLDCGENLAGTSTTIYSKLCVLMPCGIPHKPSLVSSAEGKAQVDSLRFFLRLPFLCHV